MEGSELKEVKPRETAERHILEKGSTGKNF